MPGTVDQWQPVVEIAFEGGPYAEGGLDRAALIELANMQTLLTLYAASLKVDPTMPENFRTVANDTCR